VKVAHGKPCAAAIGPSVNDTQYRRHDPAAPPIATHTKLTLGL
jgi:hypothetical protein